MLALPLFTQKSGAGAAQSRMYHLAEKMLCQVHHAFQPVQEEQITLSKLFEDAYHTRLLLEGQQNHILSDARSELDQQELRVDCGDRTLRQANRFILNAWNSTRRISHLIIPGERKICSTQNWRKEKELFKKLVLELFRKWKH